MVNHVGRPWMFDGKRFFPDTGMPIWKIARMRMLFDDMLPDPLAVATWIEKSLTTGGRPAGSARFSSRTAVDMLLLKESVSRGSDPRAAMIPKQNRAEGVTPQLDRIARRRKNR